MRCFRRKRLSGHRMRVWLGRVIACGCVYAAFACGWVRAQQGSTPSLHQRSEMNQDQSEAEANRAIDAAQEPSTLPNDVWGSYQFDHSNNSIELDLEHNKLTGYITQLGDAETDSNTPLTFFFDQSTIDGGEISFQTRVVHGVWYSFRGTIVRGDGKIRADEGYYVLRGALAIHHPQSGRDKSANEIIEKREARFKSMPQ
ncbi:MAG: hypothetical protein V4587_02340 [Acidobacteriota bacterium]